MINVRPGSMFVLTVIIVLICTLVLMLFTAIALVTVSYDILLSFSHFL